MLIYKLNKTLSGIFCIQYSTITKTTILKLNQIKAINRLEVFCFFVNFCLQKASFITQTLFPIKNNGKKEGEEKKRVKVY